MYLPAACKYSYLHKYCYDYSSRDKTLPNKCSVHWGLQYNGQEKEGCLGIYQFLNKRKTQSSQYNKHIVNKKSKPKRTRIGILLPPRPRLTIMNKRQMGFSLYRLISVSFEFKPAAFSDLEPSIFIDAFASSFHFYNTLTITMTIIKNSFLFFLTASFFVLPLSGFSHSSALHIIIIKR